MAIFEPTATPHHWKPAALAAGPFAGLQGGAVASLLTAEVEAMAGPRNWGTAISASAWFLRPTPMAELRTQVAAVTEGGRVSVVDNTLWPVGEEQPCATVRVTLSRERAVEIPGFRGSAADPVDPMRFPLRSPHAVHGRSWFMDAMEARAGGDVAWFRMHHSVVADAGPLARVLGPADWTHGIARPVQNVVADPNPNLAVQLFRPPRGAWIGIRAEARWRPEAGLGVGSGVLLDIDGEIGRVSMSVILVPFPSTGGRPGFRGRLTLIIPSTVCGITKIGRQPCFGRRDLNGRWSQTPIQVGDHVALLIAEIGFYGSRARCPAFRTG